MRSVTPIDMTHYAASALKTLVRTKFFSGTSELVLACGYAHGGVYGYFVCWETVDHQYPRIHQFVPKETEYSYKEALDLLHRTTETL